MKIFKIWRIMRTIFRKIWSWFLCIIGDIKVFPWPMFIVYDPVVCQLAGGKIREVLNILEPGDIVLRGYTRYLDSAFIPGIYSHSGIYIGENKVIHSVAEGVSEIDVLDFFQADRCAVVRLKDSQEKDSIIDKAIQLAKSYIGTKYDFFFTEGDSALYCHELTASCFPDCHIEKKIASALFGIIKKKEPVYLAQSFLDSKDFTTIIEFK